MIRTLQTGNALDYIATSDLDAGKGIMVAGRLGVTTRPLKEGERGSLETRGVFSFPKASGTVFADQATVFYNLLTEQAVASAGANVVVAGVAYGAGADGEAEVTVFLDPYAPTS